MGQSDRIKTLLQERATAFDPSLDVSESSEFYRTVIAPVVATLAPDPIDTDALEFLRTRVAQEYPSIPTGDTDAVIALMAKPLALLIEPFKAEMQHIQTAQSTRNADKMTSDQARDLAANWNVTPKPGGRSQTTVRVYYSSPRTVNVPRTAILSTDGGLNYLPTRPQIVRLEAMLAQREGREYYIDVPVIAEKEGAEYDVDPGLISRSAAFPAATRLRNLTKAEGGIGGETGQALLARVETSVTERSLTTSRGIIARLNDEFGGLLRDIVTVGAGDPEMQRDLLTARGGGDVLASGICLVIGQYCLLASQFENRGVDGRRRPQAGDRIDLNYWSFLYAANSPEQRNESFEILDVILDSRDAIPSLPAVLLLKLAGSPSVASPVSATVPGTHPGVFAAVYSASTLEVSGIPGGILSPTTERGTLLVESGQVHLLGHQDVWVRPSATSSDSATMGVFPLEPILEGRDLSATQVLNGSGVNNLIAFDATLTVSMISGSLSVGDALLTGGSGNSFGVVRERDGATVLVSPTDPSSVATVGSPFTTASGASGTITAASTRSLVGTGLDGLWYPDGLVLEILTGPDIGVYKVIAVLQFGASCMLLDRDMTDSWYGQSFRLSRSSSVDLFAPSRPILPFADRLALDLRTTIGSATVRTVQNIQSAGGQVGDSLEILSGPDMGVYRIIGFDTVAGGIAPVLNAKMSASGSGLAYRIFRASQGVQAPLIRVVPGGVRLLDASGQDTGASVPYAMPVSARPTNGLTGATLKASGVCGFVLPDPGTSWRPTGNLSASGGTALSCFTDGCLSCENGYVAVIEVTDTGDMYLNSLMPSDAQVFFTDLRQWLLDVIASLGLGNEARDFVLALSPIKLGSAPGGSTLVAKYEVCLPAEIWDTRHNVYVALPDIDWAAEIEKAGTFDGALSRFNQGLLEGGYRPSALASAIAGDTLTITEGANAGSYLISRVSTLKIATPGSIVSSAYREDRTYPVTFVVIAEEFPVSPLSGLSSFFASGIPSVTVPGPPALPYQVYDLGGALVSPWAMVQGLLQFLMQWANAMGFDAPTNVTLDEAATLEAIWRTLFAKYTVGTPTAPETVRLRFVEPTSVTVYAPKAFGGLTGVGFVKGDPGEIQGAPHGLTLPDGTLTGKHFKLWVRTAFDRFTISGTLHADAGSAVTDDALARAVSSAVGAEIDNQRERIGDAFFDFRSTSPGQFTASFRQKGEEETSETYVELDVSSGGAFAALGFGATNQCQSVAVSEGEFPVFIRPKASTRLIGATGAERLEFVPKPGLEWVFYPPTEPGQTPPPSDLPRDLVLIPRTNNTDTTYAAYIDRLFEPSMQARPAGLGDVLRVHQQKKLLDITVSEGAAFQVRDRIVGVTTEVGSPVVRLPSMPSPEFTFTSPQSTEEFDVVRVGDLVYVEEGDSSGGYVVIERYADRLVLDRPLMESTPKIIAAGNTGVIDLGDGARAIRIPGGWRRNDSDGIGDHLTIWASPHLNVNGSYPIANVQQQGDTCLLTLTTNVDFVLNEVGVHWAIAAPDSQEPYLTSLLDGRSKLGCVRPIRIYSGVPDDLDVSFARPISSRRSYLGAATTTVTVRRSQRPPYSFVRKDAYHIASSTMKTQGRDRGLYWFDVPCISLGHTPEHNIPADFRTEPKFQTYDSDGYWFDVQDPNLTFSPKERTRIVFSGHFLPNTEDDLWGNRKVLTGRNVLVSYDFSPTVDRVQALLVSTSDRNTCADSLARHFCPSYVYLDIDVVGGAPAAQVAARLYTRIDSMFAVDPLDVSVLEKDLVGAASYTHPIMAQVITHDLDRRLIESRSPNRIDDETLDANATNRTTYFIPGPDRSALTEAKIPDGERIVIRRRSS